MNLDLDLERLDDFEAPLSNDYWTGFFAGAGLVLGIAALVT